MTNEVDRCDLCDGTGMVRTQRRLLASAPGDVLELRSTEEQRPCEACDARGVLDPLASLVRAVALGQTLAWCVVHAPGGDAPMKELWRRASSKTRWELLARVYGAAMYDRVGDPDQLDAEVFARNLRDVEPPTLAEVLESAKPKRR